MPKIDVSKVRSGNKHTLKVKLEFEENGTSSTTEMRVVYRGVSMLEAEQMAADLRAADYSREAIIAQLAGNVIELPDLIDNGQPVTPTVEFFSSLDTYYLSRISQAIVDDRQGN